MTPGMTPTLPNGKTNRAGELNHLPCLFSSCILFIASISAMSSASSSSDIARVSLSHGKRIQSFGGGGGSLDPIA